MEPNKFYARIKLNTGEDFKTKNYIIEENEDKLLPALDDFDEYDLIEFKDEEGHKVVVRGSCIIFTKIVKFYE